MNTPEGLRQNGRARQDKRNEMHQAPALPLPQKLANILRDGLIAGDFAPGQRLSEQALCTRLGVSRNTLREAFRLLTKEGLLEHKVNRGVFVMTPTIPSVIDIYRARRTIEARALSQSDPQHPAAARMQQAVEDAKAAREQQNWHDVGSANMRFHAAIVALADSTRLSEFYAQVAAELRLSFFLLEDPKGLHAPYVDMNADILALLAQGRPQDAAAALEAYLDASERTVLAAMARRANSSA
jgi:DNA-binding GntR family transcriptional regulator